MKITTMDQFEKLREWVGKTETRTDTVAAWPVDGARRDARPQRP